MLWNFVDVTLLIYKNSNSNAENMKKKKICGNFQLLCHCLKQSEIWLYLNENLSEFMQKICKNTNLNKHHIPPHHVKPLITSISSPSYYWSCPVFIMSSFYVPVSSPLLQKYNLLWNFCISKHLKQADILLVFIGKEPLF